jgi:S-DNA-T family DNA segregation ATPase FtsK/SpoIIIE
MSYMTFLPAASQRERALDAMADRVERVLRDHGAPAEIPGGQLGPRIVTLYLQPRRGIRAQAIRRLQEELALAIGAPEVTIRRTPVGLVVEYPREDPRTVRFLETLTDAEPLPKATALLGIEEQGAPLLAKLSSPVVAHVLIAGTTGSGKSVLLRSIAASLLLSHPPEDVRALCLDPKGRAFAAFEGLPHLLRPPLRDGDAIAEALRGAERLMEIRDERHEDSPRVVVLIDELADILEVVEAAEDPLTRLAQRGREAGIHLVAATQYPSAAILSGVMRANFPLRLVGRVVSADDAKVAAGRHGTGAETLAGKGDFLAITGGETIRFQAAYATDDELREVFSDWKSESPAPDILPVVEEADGDSPDWLVDGTEILRENWEWWSEIRDEWGSRKKLHELLFPDKPYGGSFLDRARRIESAVEAEFTTTTTSAGAEITTTA